MSGRRTTAESGSISTGARTASTARSRRRSGWRTAASLPSLLTGDLALLHDSNGFLIAPRFRGSLTVVLINNHGGGIFEHLPVAQFDPIFEEFFATPQEVDFGRLCAAHGVAHAHVEDWPHFESLVSQLPASGIRVLELAHRPQAGRRNGARRRLRRRGQPRRIAVPTMKPKWKTAGSYSDILYQKADGIAKVTINRPEKRNAFRPETVAQMIDAFSDARDDPTDRRRAADGRRARMPTASMPSARAATRACAGAPATSGGDGVPRLNVLDLQKLIRSMPKVVIALVAGYAIGGGHVLHVVCDLTIAADNAVFGQVGPAMGSFDGGLRLKLPRPDRRPEEGPGDLVSVPASYSAAQALEMGLVNAVVPVGQA